MFKATCKLVGVMPIAFGAPIQTPKISGERPEDYEERTWRERMHITREGEVFFPAAGLKNCLTEAAAYMSERIPGKNRSTYTKVFRSGVMVVDNLMFGLKKDEVEGELRYVPSDGKTGGTTRVWRRFPVVRDWTVDATVYVIDRSITGDVLERHLRNAGRFIGLGMGRPARNGWYGRFNIEDFKFGEVDENES